MEEMNKIIINMKKYRNSISNLMKLIELFELEIEQNIKEKKERQIFHIEKYLGLDFYVDSTNSIIDYSYVNEPNIRAQLISDNREMLRFRYGTRFHEILFEEFCRYAQLQAEMLLNYFYIHKYHTDARAIKHIQERCTFDINATNLTSISFSNKLWAFCREYRLNRAYTSFNFVRMVRNHQSHRKMDDQTFSFDEYQKRLAECGIKLTEDGSFNYSKTAKDEHALRIYESEVKGTPQFMLYQYCVWYNKKPYDEIIFRLKEISKVVSENI